MIAGVYDAGVYNSHPEPTLQIFTCDRVAEDPFDPPEPAVPRMSAWGSFGAVQVGHGMVSGTQDHSWYGPIDEVRIFDGVVTQGDLYEMCFQAGGPPPV
jgi:hypothetical protein